MQIYFDNAATTPLLMFDEGRFFANPSSPHLLGLGAEREIKAARESMANALCCKPSEIIFTSGGTEGNNLAIVGYALAKKRQGIKIFACPWEHPSIIEPIKFAAEQGFAQGVIEPFGDYGKIKSAGDCLVCLSQISHETGDIFDIDKIADAIKNENPQAVIHVDGVQGFCKNDTSLKNIDMYSFSGHKIHAGFGAGGLYAGVRLVPLMNGGGQESGKRAGTENMQGIIRMAAAAERLREDLMDNHAHVAKVKAELADVINHLPNCHINAITENTSPYILNISFLGIKGETLVHILSDRGIHASMGAACRSRKKSKPMLEEMGFCAERAASAVRFSFSHLNTVEEALTAKREIIDSVTQIRKVVGHRK